MAIERRDQHANRPIAPRADPPPAVVVERSGIRALVTLCGEIDLMVERQIVETVAEIAATHGLEALQIDATGVTFIDSSGLRSVVLSRQAVLEKGLKFSLSVRSTGPVERLLLLAGLHSILGDELVYPDGNVQGLGPPAGGVRPDDTDGGGTSPDDRL